MGADHKLWLIGEPMQGYKVPSALKIYPLSHDVLMDVPEMGITLIDNYKIAGRSDESSSTSLRPDFLARAIQTSINRLPESTWTKFNQNLSLRNPILAICIVNGVLLAKQSLSTQALSKIYAFFGQEMLQAVDKFLSSVREGASTTKSSSVDDSKQQPPSSLNTTSTLEHSAASEEFLQFVLHVSPLFRLIFFKILAWKISFRVDVEILKFDVFSKQGLF